MEAGAGRCGDSASTQGLCKFPLRERQPISMRTRFLLFKRDCYKCKICQRTGVLLEVDHVIPRALGGSDKVDNLQTLCLECNRGKSDDLQ